MRRILLALLLSAASLARAQEHPEWFSESLLYLPEDVAEAAQAGKRVVLYFGQNGCPYCLRLMEVNFKQRPIVERMRKHFVALALNIWGDREVTWTDGKTMSEKQLAAALKVQFTPTLLFLDEKGAVALRMNGYYQPQRFAAALDYVSGKMESKLPFAEFAPRGKAEAARPELNPQPFFMASSDLRRKGGGKPLAVLFETVLCAGCDELHDLALKRREVLAEVAKFDFARFALSDALPIVTPSGAKLSAADWARELKVSYAPTIVFFDARGREALRMEAYFRPFHVAGALAYVSSGAYRSEPSFQRFLQARSEHMRDRGETVDLWR